MEADNGGRGDSGRIGTVHLKEKEGLSPDEKIILQAQECLKDFKDREFDNIDRAEEAIRFRSGEQWPDEIKRERENQPGGAKPVPVLDKTNQYVRQIVNEERQNRAAIRIRPVDDKGDKKVAEVFTGIIRHIEDASQAIEAYTCGGEHAIDGGFGYWRILTEYDGDMSFDQEIRIKRVPNRFSVALGRHADPDGADCKEGLIWEDVDRKVFEKLYPNAKPVSFEEPTDWAGKDTIRVAEYMRIEERDAVIYQLEDGSVSETNDGTAIQERDTTINTVKWYKVTKEEILERGDMLGSYIPIIKVVGNELIMPDGQIRLSGVIEQAMDPQRLHNYAHAGFIEHVALAPRAPWVAEEGQIENYEDDYRKANRQNIAVLKYKSVSEDGRPLPPPSRTPPPGIPPGWDKMLQNTEHGVEASFGMYGPTVGAKSQEKSGIALQEQKVQGMVGNFHFPDNLARSIQHTGKILLEWIPKVYDTERVARILGEDGEADMRYLDPNQEQAIAPRLDEYGQEIGSIYNLNVGKYDVTVSTGPSYTAKRQEAAEQQIALLQGNPELMQSIGDLVMRNMDFPGADKIADRLKTLLPPQIQEMEESEDKQPVDPKIKAMMQQMEQAGVALEERSEELVEAEKEVETQATEVNADKAQLAIQKQEIEAAKKILTAEVKMAKYEARIQQLELEKQAEQLKQELGQLSESEEGESEEKEEKLEQVNASISQLGQILERMSQTPQVPQNLVVNVDAKGPTTKEFTFTKSDGSQVTGQSKEIPDGV